MDRFVKILMKVARDLSLSGSLAEIAHSFQSAIAKTKCGTHVFQVFNTILLKQYSDISAILCFVIAKDCSQELRSGIAELVQIRRAFPEMLRHMAQRDEHACVGPVLDRTYCFLQVIAKALDVLKEHRRQAQSFSRLLGPSIQPFGYSLPPSYQYGSADSQYRANSLNPGGPVERLAGDSMGFAPGWRRETPGEERAETKRHDQQNHCVSPERLFLHVHLPCGGWILANRRAA